MDHSSISPSSFERWSNCPASPYLSSISEEQPTHVAALRGTINHEAAESFLYKRSKPEDFLGTVHKVQGHKIIIEQDPERLRPIDADLQIPDTSKFKDHTGWEPKYKYEQTISDLLDYWRKMIEKNGEAYLTR